jgi:hypothetical protein
MIQEHAAIVAAIGQRDSAGAEDALRHHLRMVLSELPRIRATHPDFFGWSPRSDVAAESTLPRGVCPSRRPHRRPVDRRQDRRLSQMGERVSARSALWRVPRREPSRTARTSLIPPPGPSSPKRRWRASGCTSSPRAPGRCGSCLVARAPTSRR